MSARASDTQVKTARDFTYIKPQRRRLTEYEALTVHMQPDHLASIERAQLRHGVVERTPLHVH